MERQSTANGDSNQEKKTSENLHFSELRDFTFLGTHRFFKNIFEKRFTVEDPREDSLKRYRASQWPLREILGNRPWRLRAGAQAPSSFFLRSQFQPIATSGFCEAPTAKSQLPRLGIAQSEIHTQRARRRSCACEALPSLGLAKQSGQIYLPVFLFEGVRAVATARVYTLENP